MTTGSLGLDFLIGIILAPIAFILLWLITWPLRTLDHTITSFAFREALRRYIARSRGLSERREDRV